MMFTTVLAAVDLAATPAHFVLEKASSYVAEGGKLQVIHVVEPQYVQYSFDPTFTGSLTRELEDNAREAARAQLAEVCAPYNIPAEQQHIVLGRAADKIHDAAQSMNADIIVVGSHARHGWRRLLGSTASAVLQGAPLDVIVARLPEKAD
jgi:universal stress protein A